MNKSKIIVNVDRRNNKAESLKELILNGVDVFVVDMEQFNHEYCIDVMEKIRKLNEQLKTNVAVMLETSGPQIHINRVSGGKATLKTNDKIRVYVNEVLGDETKFSVDYKNIIQDIKYDSTIKLTDGNVELEVLDKGEDFLLCKVVVGGDIYDNSKINIPGIKMNKAFISKKDEEDIKFASKENADYLALSYVSSMDDVLEVNDMLIDLENNHMGIMAKIENEASLEEIDDIINICEGVVIVRDSLGIEMPLERIPGIQKALINKCHLSGKLSVVATDMISANDQNLSGAEVSDLANAVLDGTDAVLLNDKTGCEEFQMETLKSTEKIIKSAEKDIDYANFLDRAVRSESQDVTGNIACSVAEIANRLKCKAIVAPTLSGYTARKMSRFRPSCPIIAISSNPNTVRSLSIYFGVYPILVDELKSLDDIVEKSKKIVRDSIDTIEGDKIIISGGYPFKEVKHTNLIEIEEL